MRCVSRRDLDAPDGESPPQSAHAGINETSVITSRDADGRARRATAQRVTAYFYTLVVTERNPRKHNSGRA